MKNMERHILFLITIGTLSACPLFYESPSWSLFPETNDDFGSDGSRLRRNVGVEASIDERTGCDDGDVFIPNRVNTSERVERLIEEMKKEKVDAYLIPHADQHLSEYISEHDKRRDYVSGFTGSAGTAVVLANGTRVLWTDGRYFLQADQQLDCDWILMKSGNPGVPKLEDWLKNLNENSTIGADARLISAYEWLKLQDLLKDTTIELKSIKYNLVDKIWPEKDRPPKSDSPVQILPLKYAGKKWEEKISDLRKELRTSGLDMIVVTAMDEIAWLFNLRGGDVPYNPVFRSYAIIDQEKILLFTDKYIGPELDLHLKIHQCESDLCVEIHPYDTILPTLGALTSTENVKKVLVPKKLAYTGGASAAIYFAVPKEKVELKPSPILFSKAIKNEVERLGMVNAHKKDAAALVDFFSFLENEILLGKHWDEISASTKLESLRAEQEGYHSLSFETISAFGPNGAVIHYSPKNETNIPITKDSLYLLDSGAQYKDGTTDVTRTLHFGNPTELEKTAYTTVLKGAIDLATLTFPLGLKLKDTRFDVLARRALYELGLDYNHGTGHGIGMFLNVHESPILVNINGNEEHKLEVGHFFSDEPGYYKPGEFGIRLETILTVVPVQTKYDEKPMLGFMPVTLVPYERQLIDTNLLSEKQCDYVNMYHAQVRETLVPILKEQQRQGHEYLLRKTAPLNCSLAGSAASEAQAKIFSDNFEKLNRKIEEKLEKERLERLEKEKNEREEKERKEKEMRERLKQERIEKERQETERKEKERIEKERSDKVQQGAVQSNSQNVNPYQLVYYMVVTICLYVNIQYY